MALTLADFEKVKLTKIDEVEIATGLSSWARTHLFIMELDDSDTALKAVKYAMENSKSKGVVQRLLHRYSSLHRRELARTISKATKMEIV